MSKSCPKCGKQVPDDAKFCMDCGYAFESNSTLSSGILGNGKIFLAIIAVIVIVGLLAISMMGNPDNSNQNVEAEKVVDITITDVLGYDSSDDKKSYTLYTEALFNKVPNDMKGYNVKTTYYDSNDTKIGSETEKLEYIYYDSEYALGFGHYTTYKLPDPDHVTVEVIKSGKVIESYTEDIDKNKIDYLN